MRSPAVFVPPSRVRKVDTRKSAKDAWTNVREVIKGRAKQAGDHVDGQTAQIFNKHYAAISIDADYHAPRLKQTAPNDLCYVTEMDVFRMLDTLRPTAALALCRVSIRYQRGFCDSAHLFSPHRLPVCSISHLRRVSCRASGILPPSRRYPR